VDIIALASFGLLVIAWVITPLKSVNPAPPVALEKAA
jgi:hypothetical protein